MITPAKKLARVTVTLDPVDVDLLDRLAALVGSNRSAEIRDMLVQLRPMLTATVSAYEAAVKQRQQLLVAATSATAAELDAISPDVERMQSQYLGMMAKLEGAAAAAQAEAEDPRPSNHGGHNPDPPSPTTPLDDEEKRS